MSDVLGPGAYGDPENPAQTRQDFNAEHNITDDELCPPNDDETPAPAPAPANDPTPVDAPVLDPAPAPDETDSTKS